MSYVKNCRNCQVRIAVVAPRLLPRRGKRQGRCRAVTAMPCHASKFGPWSPCHGPRHDVVETVQSSGTECEGSTGSTGSTFQQRPKESSRTQYMGIQIQLVQICVCTAAYSSNSNSLWSLWSLWRFMVASSSSWSHLRCNSSCRGRSVGVRRDARRGLFCGFRPRCPKTRAIHWSQNFRQIMIFDSRNLGNCTWKP